MSFARLLILLLALFPMLVRAQQAVRPITITVLGDAAQAVSGASLSLRPIADSGAAAIKGSTDTAGKAAFTLIAGSYRIRAQAKGFIASDTTLPADSIHTRYVIILHRQHTLREAVVTSSRPLLRQDGDVTILDPAPLAAAASSAFEILEKTPGIVADADGNFYMTSATPAIIYINGREMKMSAADVAAMLRALPPHSVLRVEILRTPSAKYDASGGGGIINVVLKKGVKIGVTGSVNAGVQQGVYGAQFGGANISYSDGERSAYLNLGIAQRKSLEHISSARILAGDSLLAQDAGSVYNAGNLFIGYGLGRNYGKRWETSYDGRIARNTTNNRTANESIISERSGSVATDNFSNTAIKGGNWNIDQSLDAKYKIDTAGSEWTVVLNWNGMFGHTAQDILSRFVQPTRSDISDNGDITTQRHYLLLQSDLKYKAPKALTIEAGIKATATFFRHSSDFTAMYNGTPVADPLRSTTYHYTENINAAYAQISKGWGRWIVKPGLRLETTIMDGQQTRPGDTGFSIHRADLFPYLYISRPVMRIAGFELRGYLIYRRIIQRPAYDYLNPFPRFVDQYLYEAGNPALRPQFTQNWEFNISADEHPVFAIGYNNAKDVFANVIYSSDGNNAIAERTWDNLGANRELYIRGLGGVPPGGAYFFIFGGQYNRTSYDGYYEGAPLQYQRESFTFFTYHNLKIRKKTSIVVNGFMRLKGFMQFYELGTFGALNASISHTFLHDKLAITAAMQDIFYSNRYDAVIHQGSINGTVSRYNDSRRWSLNVRYNFGFRKKEEKDAFGSESGRIEGQ